MALFVLIGLDRPDAGSLRAEVRERHLDYLAQHAGAVKLAGPFLGAEGRPVGSMVLAEAPDPASAKALQDQDPYALAGLFAHTELRPWRLVIGALD